MAISRPPLFDGLTYEQRLDRDIDLALREDDLFFEGRGKVQDTLRRIAKRLDDLNIPYAVAGDMAMWLHGFRRYTEEVSILVDHAGLHRVHGELTGHGYLPPFPRSKNLRDTETAVKIEFLIAGKFPGDGLPKPVAFPAPTTVSERIMGIACLNLPMLVQLKLASGMTGFGCLKDLGDVQELIRMLRLPRELGEQLDPYVRTKYDELWVPVQAPDPVHGD